MGTWNTKINSNDTFLDIYQAYYDQYNQGQDPTNISKQIQEDYAGMFNDPDDRNNCFFGLALALWETKALSLEILHRVKQIIETGIDIKLWKDLGADEKTLQQRQIVLDRFLTQLLSEREKPKRRKRPKFEFTYNQLINITAPDGKKTFTILEHFTNGEYIHTSSGLSWEQGGGSVFYFTGQGLFISAKWRDSETLVITHDSAIVFSKKDESFFFRGDEGKVLYIPTTLRPV